MSRGSEHSQEPSSGSSDGSLERPVGVSRREFVKGCTLLAAPGSTAITALASEEVARSPSSKRHVVVVGAGAFGGWTALHLLRGGARVTLLDTWGPGNTRASSGGDTRIIRATYEEPIYVNMALRSMELWREADSRWQRKLFRRIGALWFIGKNDRMEQAALALQQRAGLPVEALTPAEAARRFPQIDFQGVNWVLLEKEAGYALARASCAAVVDAFVAEGGDYRQLEARPGDITGGELRGVRLSDGSQLHADQYVFACGPWLKQLFPELLGPHLDIRRAEVYFFGTPSGDARFAEDRMPAWVDNTQPIFFYGVPSNQWRGFKLGSDENEPPFEPTAGDRTPEYVSLKNLERYMEMRFPPMRGAPLLEIRICQTENTPDGNFIVDRHPQAANLLLLGGGSGHGFKHGPAVGESAARIVLGQEQLNPLFGVGRLRAPA